MPAPLVSIVVRSMGRDCLANAIASVGQQTHRPLELVVGRATRARVERAYGPGFVEHITAACLGRGSGVSFAPQ